MSNHEEYNHLQQQATCWTGSNYTRLMYAAKKHNTAIVGLLLAHGAVVNARDDENATALHMAAKSNQTAVMAMLLDNGADVNASAAGCQMSDARVHRNDRPDTAPSITPLHFAAMSSYPITAVIV
jgi:ankyrin repeat protein